MYSYYYNYIFKSLLGMLQNLKIPNIKQNWKWVVVSRAIWIENWKTKKKVKIFDDYWFKKKWKGGGGGGS